MFKKKQLRRSAIRSFNRFFAILAIIVYLLSTNLTTATPLAEFVKFTTEDQLTLHGLLWVPMEKTTTVVIHVPGMTGGFAGPLDLNAIAKSLIGKRYAFMAVNMRTAGLHGMLFAKFEDYVKDIDAAVRFAKIRGFTDIVLVGHSLGGPRIIYYWTQMHEPSIRALVFSASIKSPYLEAQLRWTLNERVEYETFLQKMRDRVAEGRGRDIFTYPAWFPKFPLTLSAHTFVNIFGNPTESNASTVKFGQQVKIPVLVIHGTKDPIALPANAEAIFESLTASPQRDLKWIDGGDHFFTGVIEKYAETLTEWLLKNLPPIR